MLRQKINGESLNRHILQFQKASVQQGKKLSPGTQKIFTQQFLETLKNEISQKVKPSKSILEALKHSNSQLQLYKKQIDALKKQIMELTRDNQQLFSKIKEEEVSNNKKTCKNKNGQMKITFTNFLHIQKRDSYDNSIEVQILKEKVTHFQQYKKLKESRYMQIIERQAKLVSQINMLNYKNQTLNSRLQSLEQLLASNQIQKVSTEVDKGKNCQKVFDQNQQLNIYINYSQVDDKKYRNSLRVENSSNGKRDSNLIVSCTKDIQIDSSYNIERQAILKTQKFRFEQQEENEIDYLLQDMLPFTHTQSNISSDRSKQKLDKEERIALGQSEIKITL